MILRRVMQHVKDQNWTAVALDFVIVVVGVFIGIQVSNWNEARTERTRERHALELLMNEAQNNVAYSRLIIYRAARLQAEREAALAKLHGQSSGNGHPHRGLAVMSNFRDMTPIRAALDQLTASGEITLIRSDAVRNALSAYEGVVIFHDRARKEFIDRAPDVLAMASPYMSVHYDPEQPIGYRVDMDWPTAAKDRALVNAVNRVMGDQITFNERREIILDQVQTLCDRLGEVLGRQCEPPDWVADEMQQEAGQ